MSILTYAYKRWAPNKRLSLLWKYASLNDIIDRLS